MLPVLNNSENVYWGNHAETYSRDLREQPRQFTYSVSNLY
jgi:hypothetical protein